MSHQKKKLKTSQKTTNKQLNAGQTAMSCFEEAFMSRLDKKVQQNKENRSPFQAPSSSSEDPTAPSISNIIQKTQSILGQSSTVVEQMEKTMTLPIKASNPVLSVSDSSSLSSSLAKSLSPPPSPLNILDVSSSQINTTQIVSKCKGKEEAKKNLTNSMNSVQLNAKGYPTVAGKVPRKKLVAASGLEISSVKVTPEVMPSGNNSSEKTCQNCHTLRLQLSALSNQNQLLRNNIKKLQGVIEAGQFEGKSP